MATITVTLDDNQVIGAKDHFDTQNNTEALDLFRDWVGTHADAWFVNSLEPDLRAIYDALIADPTKIDDVKTELGL